MHKPKELTDMEMPDIKYPCRYDLEPIIECSEGNFNKLLDEYNNLVEVVNKNELAMGTLISWLCHVIGKDSVVQLLDILEKGE